MRRKIKLSALAPLVALGLPLWFAGPAKADLITFNLDTFNTAGFTAPYVKVDVSRIKTSHGIYAGPLADVQVLGGIAPNVEGTNTLKFRIGAGPTSATWTPKNIWVVSNNGGAIGSSTTVGGRQFSAVKAFGRVFLNANDNILIGQQDFIDRIGKTPAENVPATVKTILLTLGSGGPKVLITAGTLSLVANGKIAQQNTSGLASLTSTGLFVGSGAAAADKVLLIGRFSVGAGGKSTPDLVELNGAISNGLTTLTNETAALSDRVEFASGVSPGPFYRLNTCGIFTQGACTPENGLPNLSIAPEQLAELRLIQTLDPAAVEDPTVASATNEEIWRDPE